MTWNNDPLTVYHGTDDASAKTIKARINPLSGKPLTDFGQGFYVTTYLHQAVCWANRRCHTISVSKATRSVVAKVLRFEIDRYDISRLDTLVFIRDDPDYWDLVEHCRHGLGSHQPKTGKNYDVVFGPVSLWPQTLVVKDCDQISFHSTASVGKIRYVTRRKNRDGGGWAYLGGLSYVYTRP